MLQVSRSKKKKAVASNPVINTMVNNKPAHTSNIRIRLWAQGKRNVNNSQKNLPDWAKTGYKPAYKEGTGLKNATVPPVSTNTKQPNYFNANTQLSTGAGANMPLMLKQYKAKITGKKLMRYKRKVQK